MTRSAGQARESRQAVNLAKPLWLRAGVKPYLVFADTVAFVVALELTTEASLIHTVVLVVTLTAFACVGLYRSRLTLSLLDDIPHVLVGVLIGATLQIAVYGTTQGVAETQDQIRHAGVFFALVAALRGLAYRLVKQARSLGLVRHRAAVVGSAGVGVRLVRSLLEHKEYGLDPVGFIESTSEERPGHELPLPVLGDYRQLGAIIKQQGIRNILVAFGQISEDELVAVLRTCDRLACKVYVVPRLCELYNASHDTDQIWGIPLVQVRRTAFQSRLWPLKRVFDVVLAALAMVILLPVLILCALAVRIEGGPGIIFRQERVGRDGRHFELLKFRSLRPVDTSKSDTHWNVRPDDTIGPVGRFMRKSSLDELPQLWNILIGEMTIVGPRPERPFFVSKFSSDIPWYTARHRVPAGLTGWAQVHGLRGDTSIEDRICFDNYYIENWSLWLDAKIVLRTVQQVLGGKG